MGRHKRVFGVGSFYLSDDERKEVRKYLKMQVRGELPKPIENLTLNKYFALIKEIELSFCDENGVSQRYPYNDRVVNFRDMDAETIARMVMDGRQMFHSDYGHPEGILVDRNHDSPEEFKWWYCNSSISGHPWETIIGNFYPCILWKTGYNFENSGNKKMDYKETTSNKWIFYISSAHRCTIYGFRAFIRLRKLGYPVIWQPGQYDKRELTKRYLVDLSSEPKWYDMDETTYAILTGTER